MARKKTRTADRTAEKLELTADFAIGEVARRTGVKVATIRYYESIALLAQPTRSAAGRRVYDEGAVQRLKFIRHARELGLEIDDIRRLANLSDQPQRSCADVDAIAKAHLADINSRIKRLKALRSEMQQMISDCAQGQVCQCRILEVLSDHSYCRHEAH